jgi:hypothetical protein
VIIMLQRDLDELALFKDRLLRDEGDDPDAHRCPAPEVGILGSNIDPQPWQ